MRRRKAPAIEWPAVRAGEPVAVCHPDWRGVRTAAHGHPHPVVETADAGANAAAIVDGMTERAVPTVIVHGYPPGTDELIATAAGAGIATRLVLHSSMAQHGTDAGEAEVTSRAAEMLATGDLGALGFVKEGQAEAFAALGIPSAWVPNRVPTLPELDRMPLSGDPAVGVFAFPYWRKNVTTMLGATAILGGTAHVMQLPDVQYLQSLPVVAHGELPWREFQSLQASVDINLYVTLSECDPLTPMESYLAGVPCLIARTSSTFRSDPELWALSTVDELDNPNAIAAAATMLLERRDRAVELAEAWMQRRDEEAAARWSAFVA